MGVGDGAVWPGWLRVLWTFRVMGSSLDSESWRFGLVVRERSVALAELLADRGEKLPGARGVGLAGCMGAAAVKSGGGVSHSPRHILTGSNCWEKVFATGLRLLNGPCCRRRFGCAVSSGAVIGRNVVGGFLSRDGLVRRKACTALHRNDVEETWLAVSAAQTGVLVSSTPARDAKALSGCQGSNRDDPAAHFNWVLRGAALL